MGFAGGNPLRFLKQLDQFGLKGKFAVLGNTTSTDEGILRVMGEEGVGIFTAGWYAAGLDTPDNKKFVAGINEAYKHDPGFYTAGPVHGAAHHRGGAQDHRRQDRRCRGLPQGDARGAPRLTARSARCGSTSTARRCSTSTSARWRG